MDQWFQHQRADPPLLPASRALSLPGSKEPLDAFPPLLAISWTSSFGLLAKLPGFVLPVAEVVPAVSSEPPEFAAPRDWPPLLAISCTSSLGLLAKLPGFVFPVEDMTRCWHRKDICSWMNTGEEAAFVDTIKFEAWCSGESCSALYRHRLLRVIAFLLPEWRQCWIPRWWRQLNNYSWDATEKLNGSFTDLKKQALWCMRLLDMRRHVISHCVNSTSTTLNLPDSHVCEPIVDFG